MTRERVIKGLYNVLCEYAAKYSLAIQFTYTDDKISNVFYLYDDGEPNHFIVKNKEKVIQLIAWHDHIDFSITSYQKDSGFGIEYSSNGKSKDDYSLYCLKTYGNYDKELQQEAFDIINKIKRQGVKK